MNHANEVKQYAKKPVTIQHNRAKENNKQKAKKNFSGFYTEDDPKIFFKKIIDLHFQVACVGNNL